MASQSAEFSSINLKRAAEKLIRIRAILFGTSEHEMQTRQFNGDVTTRTL
jgi:hypothetical protein